MRILSAVAFSFVPVTLLFLVATHPWGLRLGPWPGAAILASCAAGIVFRRSGAAFGLALVLLGLLILPKLDWMIHMQYSGLRELMEVRGKVEAFKTAHGRPPRDPAELGILPELEIWTVDAQGKEHIHPRTAAVSVRSSSGTPTDDGTWGYDPATGRVFLSCTGLEPKLRHTALHEF